MAKWQSLTECILYMWTQDIGCDVTLIVGEGQEMFLPHVAHIFPFRARTKKTCRGAYSHS